VDATVTAIRNYQVPSLESQENPKRRTRSDYEYTNQTNHPLDMMTPKPTKRNKELTGEYIKPITPAIPHSDTPASGSGDAATLTTNEANTDQTLDKIPVKPIKNPTEDTDKLPEPITTTIPPRDNLEAGINDTTSLTATEEETHILQTQTGSTDEVWQSQRNTMSNKVPNSPPPGSSSKQHVETLIENPGNRERKRGSDGELPHPAPLLVDTIIPWTAKRNRGFTGPYVKPRTTTSHQHDIPASGSRNTAPLTTNETEKSAMTNVSSSQVANTTHEFHPRTAETHDRDSLTDTSPSQPDTKKCMQVGRATYAVTSQPGTYYTFNPGIATRTFQGQRPQPVVTNPVCDDYDSIVVIDSSGPPNNLTMELASPREFHRRKKPRTGQAGHAKAQAGARRRK
jgi:hypothetical protein